MESVGGFDDPQAFRLEVDRADEPHPRVIDDQDTSDLTVALRPSLRPPPLP
jgi:hypothetical protein